MTESKSIPLLSLARNKNRDIKGGRLASGLAQKIAKTEDNLIVLDPSSKSPAAFKGARQVIGRPSSGLYQTIFEASFDALTVKLENINTRSLIQLAAEGMPII